MQHHRAHPKSGPARKRPRMGVLIVFGSIACFGLLLLIVGLSEPGRSTPRARDPAERTDVRNQTSSPATTAATDGVDAEEQPLLIDDDGKTLWLSPTDGAPLDLGYLPPGAQIILSLRPRQLLQNAEGAKARDALGPTGAQAIALLEQRTKAPLDRIERLVVGWQVASDGNWQATFVVTADADVMRDAINKVAAATETVHGEQTYRVAEDWAYFVPAAGDGQRLVVAPTNAITDIVDLAGEPPPLRRDAERLLALTDAERDATILFAPNSLFSESGDMFNGQMTRLREPLFWFLGDELSAAALSLDWGENFFVELVATPTLDTPPERATRILAERVAEVPDKIEAYVVGLQPQPFGRMIIARFPAMVRKLCTYTRSGFDSDHVVLNAYLPVVAGHNLLLGAELTLAESMRGAGTVAEATSPSQGERDGGQSVEEKLRRPTTLRFGRDTLDAALRQLSQDIGVTIEIRGPDLQADGITKNQSFGIDIADKPAQDVLIEILRLANPDKTATGPDDVKQKLVYVIEKSDDGREHIVVTTRAAAATRGDALPAVFHEAEP